MLPLFLLSLFRSKGSIFYAFVFYWHSETDRGYTLQIYTNKGTVARKLEIMK